MCEECGAAGNECETRFHECLGLEFTDPADGRVHHLTVSAYMLQHSSRLTREGWLYERGLLHEFIMEGKPPAQMRLERKDAVDSGTRTFAIKSRDHQPVVLHTPWSRTILDVRSATADVYCQDVTTWARAVLDDSEKISIGYP